MQNFFGRGGNSFGQGSPMPGPFGNMMSMFSKFQEFMQNPIGYFMSSGINIPQNIRNNPEAITNYLRSSGQMTEEQYNQAAQMANMAQSFFGKKF